MALEGFLHEFELTDILQLIYLQKKTGVLDIEGDAEKVMLEFVDANVVHMEMKKEYPNDGLGRILLKKELIKPDELSTALTVQKTEGIRLEEVLLKRNMINKEILTEIITGELIDAIVELFSWKEGMYEFIPKEIPVDKESISIDTHQLIMEGLRIVYEWSMVEGRLDLGSVYKQLKKPDAGQLDPIEKYIFSLIDGDNNVSKIIHLSHYKDIDTSRAILSLEEKGIIKPLLISPTEAVGTIPNKKSGLLSYIAVYLVIIVTLSYLFLGNLREFIMFTRSVIGIELENIKTEIDVYKTANSVYPAELKIITERKDLWGRQYIYKPTESGFKVFSAGADGVTGTKDDVY